MLMGLAIGIVGGLAIAAAIVVAFTDTTFPEFFARFATAKFAEAAGAGLVAMAAFIIGFMVLIPVHEAGHLVAGLLSGYKFVSFRIFNYTIIRIDGKLRVKKYAVAGTGGQCLLLPPEVEVERVPTAWYNLGGVLANLLVLPLLLALVFIDGHPYLSVFAWVLVLVDVLILLFNGVPMKISGTANDAYNALSLRNNPVAKRGLVLALKTNAKIQDGVRPRDMPDEWFEVPAHINYRDQLEVSLPLMAASRLLDNVDFDKAREAFENLYAHKSEIIGLYVKELECELVFLRLITGDADGASQLLTPELRKYIEAYRSTMSSKERVLCAMALYLDKDPDKAREIFSGLSGRRADYLLQGEVSSDLAIMEEMLLRHDRAEG